MTKPNVNISKFFRSDRDAAENGKWFAVAPGIELKIRKATSKKAADVRRKLAAGFPNGIPEAMQHDNGLKNLAYGIIVDWKGVEVDGELAMEYDPDMMLDLLNELPDLAEFVASISIDDSAYRINDDDTVKNC